MKKLFLRLRPLERRLLIGGIAVLFALINVTLVWPHFSDFSEAQGRLDKANSTLSKYETAITQQADYEKKVKVLEQEGGSVSTDDQQNEFLRTVQNQSILNNVNITGTRAQKTRTNEFFLEQEQDFDMQSREDQLVSFLYALGAADSMIRVRAISLRPDNQATRYQLAGRIKFVASYLKKPKPRPAATGTTPKPAAITAAQPATAVSAKKPGIAPVKPLPPAVAKTNSPAPPPFRSLATNKPVIPKKS